MAVRLSLTGVGTPYSRHPPARLSFPRPPSGTHCPQYTTKPPGTQHQAAFICPILDPLDRSPVIFPTITTVRPPKTTAREEVLAQRSFLWYMELWNTPPICLFLLAGSPSLPLLASNSHPSSFPGTQHLSPRLPFPASNSPHRLLPASSIPSQALLPTSSIPSQALLPTCNIPSQALLPTCNKPLCSVQPARKAEGVGVWGRGRCLSPTLFGFPFP